MLPPEFYLTNATTVLLWLFQNFDHRLLISLITLGAVCVLVSICVLVSRLVCFFLLFIEIFLSFLFQLSRSVFYVFIRRHIVRPLHRPRLPSYQLQSQSNLLRRLATDNSVELASLDSSARQLNLPQSLALNPGQWAELETRSSQPQLADRFDSPRLLASSNLVRIRPPLRRSRRLQRARVCSPCICSN